MPGHINLADDRGPAEPAWVVTQTMQMRQRELEAQDREYEERLMCARKLEAKQRAMARARVSKRQVCTKLLPSGDASQYDGPRSVCLPPCPVTWRTLETRFFPTILMGQMTRTIYPRLSVH